MSQTRAGRAPDEWGEEPAQNIITIIIIIIININIIIIIIIFFFLPFFLSVCVSVTEFSEVLPHFFPPPTFSSVRVGGGSGGGGWLRWYL